MGSRKDVKMIELNLNIISFKMSIHTLKLE